MGKQSPQRRRLAELGLQSALLIEDQPIDFEKEWRRIGAVLEMYNQLEFLMAEVIAAYLRPQKERMAFFVQYLMHTTIVPFGAKRKLVVAIARETRAPTIDNQRLHLIMNHRNALAHFSTLKGLRVNRNALRVEPTGPYLVVETIKGGDLKFADKPRVEVIAEAMEAIGEATKEVEALKRHVEQLAG